MAVARREMDVHVPVLCLCFACALCLQPIKADNFQNCLDKNLTGCLRCHPGTCGKFCDRSCFGKCMFDCDITTCECRSCADGFHASNCSLNCSAECGALHDRPATCKRNTGACKDGCLDGRCSTQSGCSDVCSIHCVNSTCMYEDCTCKYGCDDGYWGAACREQCDNCTKCDRDNGTCSNPDKPASSDLRCSGCTDGRCERALVCRKGCTPGLHGARCQIGCPSTCQTCHQFTGVCEPTGFCSTLSTRGAAGLTLLLCVLTTLFLSGLYHVIRAWRSVSTYESTQKKCIFKVLGSTAALLSLTCVVTLVILFISCFV